MTPPTAVSVGSPTLLLFPTALERDRFEDQGGLERGHALQAVCGFGPIAAAARTAQLLQQLRPRRVLLLGIAGAYDTETHPVGRAYEFGEVAVHGVGVGEGAGHLSPPALGFPQWPGHEGPGHEGPGHEGASAVEDRLRLAAPQDLVGPGDGGLLLTTCAASDTLDQAAQRRSFFPAAVAEDMEGFAVALACALAGTPLRIVRGISNRVGDRDPKRWRIPGALAAARRYALDLLRQADWDEAGASASDPIQPGESDERAAGNAT